eukprot:CAMPEP_0113950114 /NCGR_PEP_ID=MMETSP1339-20121228/79329_1 /TAXON_ID=94617 /ORGANISM="Fibrocapsa japonica" /LENGTH=128 /DNA_ID=CAMNT_0000957851 /DNA_START=41 /DNA_END=424 /DNA_ORIENTATION=+ /assembly_acc=CAM_ASM_000762
MAAIVENAGPQAVLEVLKAFGDEVESACNLMHEEAISPRSSPGNSWSKPSEHLETALTVIFTANNSISNSSTKFALLFKASPNVEQASSICKELSSSCEKLSTAVRILLPCGSSQPLYQNLTKNCRAV